MADKIKIIDPFTNIPLAPLPTATSDNQGGTFLSNLREINVGDGGSNVFRADKQGIWLGGKTFAVANFSVTMAGAMTANSFTVVGGTIRYGKTSFTDNAHTGYYFGVEGLYAGKAADTTLFKFAIGTGNFEYTGKVVADPTTSNLPAAAISGSITASQIGSVNSTAIVGSITAGQIASITAGQITGSITASQITSITAGQITGSITASQIGSVNATAITGSITSSQITSLTAGQITGQITASQIATITASQITGAIVASQISSVNASAITGSITSSQIGSVAASTITGSITASQITSIAATQITGSITASQIASVNASTITGAITSSQISSVAATTITGSIVSSQIGSVNASVINGVIISSQLADQIINNLSLFATDLRPIKQVNTLPTLPDTAYPVGATVYLTTDQKLYRNAAGTWSASAAASDITGTLTASQIGSVNSSAITGLILAAQISSIAATQITGSIQSSQIGSVAASTITGSITASQITSLATTQLTGTLTASQIASVNASAITGTITASQIDSVNASSITGTITSSQIASVAASTITGQVTSSQIQSISASQITGSISASQISSVYASAISGSISASQISSVYASAISGQITAGQINSVNASAITGTITYSQIGSINATTITINQIQSSQIGSVNASTINAGQLNVGGTNQPTAIVIARSNYDANGTIRWVGGSKVFEDSSNYLGLTSTGERIYFYTGTYNLFALFQRYAQASFYTGIFCGGAFNVGNTTTNQDARFTGKLKLYQTGEDQYIQSSNQIIRYYAYDQHEFFQNGTIKHILDNNFWTAGNVYGTAKYFNIPHPDGSARRLQYTAQESPDVVLRYRGIAKLDENGICEIIPEKHFSLVTEKEGKTTINLTATVPNQDLYVDYISNEKVVVNGKPTTEFMYEIMAIRKGYLNAPVEIDNKDDIIAKGIEQSQTKSDDERKIHDDKVKKGKIAVV